MSEDKVTKQRDPKRQAAGRKGYEKYMAKLKADILKNVGNGGSSSSNSTNGGINTTNDSTTTTGCIRHYQTQQRHNNWSIAQRLCCL